jgi:hypothetical protein
MLDESDLLIAWHWQAGFIATHPPATSSHKNNAC